MHDVRVGKIARLRVGSCVDARSSLSAIVVGTPQLRGWAKQQPVRAWLAIRHANAASVQYAHVAHLPIELHMGVPTHNQRGIEPCK